MLFEVSTLVPFPQHHICWNVNSCYSFLRFPRGECNTACGTVLHGSVAQRRSQELWRRGGIWTRTLLKSLLTLIITLYAGSSPGTSLLALCLLVYLVAREKGKKHERTHNNPLIHACPFTKTTAQHFQIILAFEFSFLPLSQTKKNACSAWIMFNPFVPPPSSVLLICVRYEKNTNIKSHKRKYK